MAQDFSDILYVHFVGDGVTTDFQYGAPVLEVEDVLGTVDGTSVPVTSVDQGTTFRITPAPAVGTDVVLFRDSDVTQTKNTFPNPTNLKSENLDENGVQNVYLHQETRALILEALSNFGFFTASQISTDSIPQSATADDVQSKLTELFGIAFGSILWGNIGGVLNNQNDLVAEFATKTDDATFTAHTADTNIHYTQSNISITESQISDFGNYALSGHDHDFEYIQLTEKAQANGVATLDSVGIVPTNQLPAVVPAPVSSVDGRIGAVTLVDLYLALTGGTLSGDLNIVKSGVSTIRIQGGDTSQQNIEFRASTGAAKAVIRTTGTGSGTLTIDNRYSGSTRTTTFAADGNVFVSALAPTSAGHLTRKDYVDTFLPLTGGTLSSNLEIRASNPRLKLTSDFTGAGKSWDILAFNNNGRLLVRELSTSGVLVQEFEFRTDGNISVPASAPLAINHLTRKDYVDAGDRVLTRTVTASTTLLVSDEGGKIDYNSASAGNITINPVGTTAYVIGSQYLFKQKGTGQFTLVAGAGVTLESEDSLLTSAKRYTTVSAIYDGADTWTIIGNLV